MSGVAVATITNNVKGLAMSVNDTVNGNGEILHWVDTSDTIDLHMHIHNES